LSSPAGVWLALGLLGNLAGARAEPGSVTFLNPTTAAAGMGALGHGQSNIHLVN
jgi:hypothetical protein